MPWLHAQTELKTSRLEEARVLRAWPPVSLIGAWVKVYLRWPLSPSTCFVGRNPSAHSQTHWMPWLHAQTELQTSRLGEARVLRAWPPVSLIGEWVKVYLRWPLSPSTCFVGRNPSALSYSLFLSLCLSVCSLCLSVCCSETMGGWRVDMILLSDILLIAYSSYWCLINFSVKPLSDKSNFTNLPSEKDSDHPILLVSVQYFWTWA